MRIKDCEPFLRWAGGKRWLADSLCPLLEEIEPKTYIEPFLGSGAVFFRLAPAKAILSDLNGDLINAYRQVAIDPEKLLKAVEKIPVTEKSYYFVRERKPASDFERAVRFIFLNRTCYGGIYRENRLGQFNTPYGGGSRTPEPLRTYGLLDKAHRLLSTSKIKIMVSDFETAIAKATQGDVVYCDPTYHAVTRDQFDRYGSTIFDWSDQVRLARAALLARMRGAIVVISNTFCSEIKDLYAGAFRIKLDKNKSIGKTNTNPHSHKEYLIVMDPFEDFELWSHLGKIESLDKGLRLKSQELRLTKMLESSLKTRAVPATQVSPSHGL